MLFEAKTKLFILWDKVGNPKQIELDRPIYPAWVIYQKAIFDNGSGSGCGRGSGSVSGSGRGGGGSGSGLWWWKCWWSWSLIVVEVTSWPAPLDF